MADTSMRLPCDPDYPCQDRFDICDSNEDEVLFCRLLERLFSNTITTVNGIVDILETIAISLRGTADTDYDFLCECFSQYWHERESFFFDTVWPIIVKLALEMPELFPSKSISWLSPRNNYVILSRRQVSCLVIHQFLCTLQKPPWMTEGSVDFHIWYSPGTPHPAAVKAYLFALFRYFELLAEPNDVSPLKHHVAEWPITLNLRSVSDEGWRLRRSDARLLPLEVIESSDLLLAEHQDSLMGLPNDASVIFANKDVGFGRTASQEEMIVGTSPELCIVVLFQPTLSDKEILVVEGAQAMISMNGYGRDACFDHTLEPDYNSTNWRKSKWRKRTVLYMDALELDAYDLTTVTPDVVPGNVDRELRKAYTAFSYFETPTSLNPRQVVTGLWGCGSFCGNKEIKSLIQWVAASMANTQLLLVCPGEDSTDFISSLRGWGEKIISQRCSVDQVLDFLHSLGPHDAAARCAFDCMEKYAAKSRGKNG